jgi:hypothetical protein
MVSPQRATFYLKLLMTSNQALPVLVHTLLAYQSAARQADFLYPRLVLGLESCGDCSKRFISYLQHRAWHVFLHLTWLAVASRLCTSKQTAVMCALHMTNTPVAHTADGNGVTDLFQLHGPDAS